MSTKNSADIKLDFLIEAVTTVIQVSRIIVCFRIAVLFDEPLRWPCDCGRPLT